MNFREDQDAVLDRMIREAFPRDPMPPEVARELSATLKQARAGWQAEPNVAPLQFASRPRYFRWAALAASVVFAALGGVIFQIARRPPPEPPAPAPAPVVAEPTPIVTPEPPPQTEEPVTEACLEPEFFPYCVMTSYSPNPPYLWTERRLVSIDRNGKRLVVIARNRELSP